MADLADMLVASGLQSSQNVPDISGSLTKGAELGLHVAKVQQQREEIEKAKIENRQAKIKEVSEDILKAKTMAGKQLAGYQKFLSNKIVTYKVDDVFDPDTVAMITASPDNLDRFDVIVDDVQNGRSDFPTAVKTLKDQGLFYDVTPDKMKELRKASEVATSDRTAMERAKVQADATFGRQKDAQYAAGDVEVRKKTGADFVKFIADGGESGAMAKLEKIKKVRKDLKEGKIKTGTASTFIPFASGDKGQALLNEDVKAATDTIRGAVSLKGSLDSQFSAKEAEMAFGRAFDPSLSNEKNIEKLDSMINELESDVKNKAAIFKQEGFISPRDAKANPSAQKTNTDDWRTKISSAKMKYKALPDGEKKKFVLSFAKKFGIKPGDVLKTLGE